MSTETDTTTEVVDEVKVETPEGEKTEAKELSPVEKELAELKAQQAKDAELLKKLRKFEKENKEKADKEAIEAGKFKELWEQEKAAREAIESKVKAKELDSAIRAELANFKAKAPETVLKLIDKAAIQWKDDGGVDTKSIETALKALKKSDPILFEEEQASTPSVKRATEGDVVGGYEKDIRAARTQKEIEAVMRKYNMLQ